MTPEINTRQQDRYAKAIKVIPPQKHGRHKGAMGESAPVLNIGDYALDIPTPAAILLNQ